MGKEAAVTYNLKSTTGQFNVHEEKYTPEMRQYIQEELTEMIYYFGYAKVQDNNPTGFFEYPNHAFENLAMLNKFKIDSQAALDQVSQDGYKATRSYSTDDKNNFPLWWPVDLINGNRPGYDYAKEKIDKAIAAKNAKQSK